MAAFETLSGVKEYLTEVRPNISGVGEKPMYVGLGGVGGREEEREGGSKGKETATLACPNSTCSRSYAATQAQVC